MPGTHPARPSAAPASDAEPAPASRSGAAEPRSREPGRHAEESGSASGRSRLQLTLAIACAVLIALASLQPFAGWEAPPRGQPFFLFVPLPPRIGWPDLWFNVLAYLPLGFTAALVVRADGRRAGTTVALAAALALSFAMESLQGWLPSRVSSTVDLLSNVAGAAVGAGLAHAYDRAHRLRSYLREWRRRTFAGGRSGDVGLTLLAVWLVAQVNPAIPPFAATFHPALLPAGDPAEYLIEASEIGLNVIGVSLYAGLMLRRRRLGAAVLWTTGSMLALKAVASAFMLSTPAWKHWLHPTVTLGLAAGLIALFALARLPRAAQMVITSVALLSALVTQLLVPDEILARAPLSMFNWSYGQLGNFNGLTRAILTVWPLAVTGHLFALAGRPAWGRDDTRWL